MPKKFKSKKEFLNHLSTLEDKDQEILVKSAKQTESGEVEVDASDVSYTEYFACGTLDGSEKTIWARNCTLKPTKTGWLVTLNEPHSDKKNFHVNTSLGFTEERQGALTIKINSKTRTESSFEIVFTDRQNRLLDEDEIYTPFSISVNDRK